MGWFDDNGLSRTMDPDVMQQGGQQAPSWSPSEGWDAAGTGNNPIQQLQRNQPGSWQAYGGYVPPNGNTGIGGTPNGALLGGSPQGNVQAFIQQWQQTHNPTEGIGGLADALSQGGYGGVSRYMYGNTPSNNELSLNGEKYKVLGGEGTSGAYWYKPGMDDSPNGGGMSQNYGGYGSLLNPWTQGFQRRSPEEIANDPSFKFQQEQGNKAIQGSAAARGTLLTGGTMKDLAGYNQGLASTFDDKYYGRDMGEYLLGRQNFYDNQDRPYNKLLGVSNSGQGAANALTAAGSSYGSNASDLMTGGGNASAAGSIGQGNIWSNFLSGLGRYPQYGTR